MRGTRDRGQRALSTVRIGRRSSHRSGPKPTAEIRLELRHECSTAQRATVSGSLPNLLRVAIDVAGGEDFLPIAIPQRIRRVIQHAGRVGPAAVSSGAGPPIVPRGPHQTGAHRIAFHVSKGGDRMREVHWARVEPVFPEMATTAVAPIEVMRAAQMSRADRLRQVRGASRDGHEMNMVRHQAVADRANSGPAELPSESAQVEVAIVVVQEYQLPVVSTLRNVMRHSGNNDSRDARHETKLVGYVATGKRRPVDSISNNALPEARTTTPR